MENGKSHFTFILFFLVVVIFSFFYHEEIETFAHDFIAKRTSNVAIEKDEYARNGSYFYIQNTNNFIAKDKAHLKNIFYTILDSGSDSVTFYCDDNYSNCLNDVNELSNDSNELSKFNHFVHPYHSFSKINVKYSNKGKITIYIKKTYQEDEIVKINNKVDEVLKKVNDYKTDKEKIKYLHDYIINNSKYLDVETNDKTDPIYYKATGVLLNNAGLCESYTDAMAIFLTELEIPNYKIASDNHIWNLVYLDGSWYHLDLTWDDPVVSDGKDYLRHDYFLIKTKKLHELDHESHNFDYVTYKEASY